MSKDRFRFKGRVRVRVAQSAPPNIPSFGPVEGWLASKSEGPLEAPPATPPPTAAESHENSTRQRLRKR